MYRQHQFLVLDQYRRQCRCSRKRTHLWRSDQRCGCHKFIPPLIDSPRGDHCQILHLFALCVVRLCFLSEWQEEAVFFGTECLLLFQPSRLLPAVCCATAGCGRGLNGEYERTTWFDFSYFFAAGLFSLLSAIWNQTCQYLASLRWKTAHTAAAFIAHKCSTTSSERPFT